jgi:glycosyltransferase involved in cell wall biosynthesis
VVGVAVAAWRPQVVICQGDGREELAQQSVHLGYRTIIRAVTTECVDAIRKRSERDAEIARIVHSRELLIVSNSKFVATHVRECLGLDSPVLYPLIRFDRCSVGERRSEYVTFVNPNKVKGVEVALQVAALLPHRRFLFVESWPLDRASYDALQVRLKDLPNVTFRRRTTRVRDLYERTGLLFMPSQWQEAFGRVILEAGINGIPAVASRVGGIPEAVGDGGVLLAPSDPPARWAETIERILSDNDLYARLSRRAVANAHDAKFNAEQIATRFLEIADEHCRGGSGLRL